MMAGGDYDYTKPIRYDDGNPVFYDYYLGAEPYQAAMEAKTKRAYKITGLCPNDEFASCKWKVEPDTDCAAGSSFFARMGGTQYIARSYAARLTALTGTPYVAKCISLAWFLPDYCRIEKK